MEEVPKKTRSKEIKISKRPATEADTEFARKTHHTAYHDVIVRQFGNFDEKMQDEFFVKSWKPETHKILLSGNSKVGYCSFENFPDHIFVHELVLTPEFQGLGIGSNVLQEVLEEAKTKNIPVRLQVLKENQAQHLYRKLGFKDSGSTDTHIQMEYEVNRTPPKFLTDTGLSMFVNTIKLRELPLPIEEIDIKELLWHFDMPVWEKDGTDDWNLTPREVIKKSPGSSEHQKLVEIADTSYPLIITKYKSRLVILDGVHRLVKLYKQGNQKIKAKIIPTEYLSLKEYQSEN